MKWLGYVLLGVVMVMMIVGMVIVVKMMKAPRHVSISQAPIITEYIINHA